MPSARSISGGNSMVEPFEAAGDESVAAPGGHPYAGAERNDVHGATVVARRR